MAKKKNNIIHIRKRIPANAALLIFLIVLLYIVYTIFTYISSNHISEYEVQQGVIASNNTYRGLILRDETVYYADRAGYINYYVKNGSKIPANALVYSIDSDGSISSRITEQASSSDNLDSAELSQLVSDINTFTTAFNSDDFQTVYTFKSNISSELNQSLSSAALSSLESSVADAITNNTFFKGTSAADGIVALYVDGKEDLTIDTFTYDDLNSSGYSRTNLDETTEVQKADPVYKQICTEKWNIIIAITEHAAESFAQTSSLKIRFTKDDYTVKAACSLMKDKEGQHYLCLSLNSGMIRYIDDRYEEIELLAGEKDGLKVPVSAIAEKEFFTVPKEYFVDAKKPYLLVIGSDNKTTEITPTIFYEDDTYYYIDDENISEGTAISLTDSQKTYTIGTDKETLKGVYNINKGYATFRYIEILSETDDYVIVKSGVSYSISLYDHIALEGSRVTQNQTITK